MPEFQNRAIPAGYPKPDGYVTLSVENLAAWMGYPGHQQFSHCSKASLAASLMASEFQKQLKTKFFRSPGRIYCLFEIMMLSSLLVGRNGHFHKEEIE